MSRALECEEIGGWAPGALQALGGAAGASRGSAGQRPMAPICSPCNSHSHCCLCSAPGPSSRPHPASGSRARAAMQLQATQRRVTNAACAAAAPRALQPARSARQQLCSAAARRPGGPQRLQPTCSLNNSGSSASEHGRRGQWPHILVARRRSAACRPHPDASQLLALPPPQSSSRRSWRRVTRCGWRCPPRAAWLRTPCSCSR